MSAVFNIGSGSATVRRAARLVNALLVSCCVHSVAQAQAQAQESKKVSAKGTGGREAGARYRRHRYA